MEYAIAYMLTHVVKSKNYYLFLFHLSINKKLLKMFNRSLSLVRTNRFYPLFNFLTSSKTTKELSKIDFTGV